MKRALIALAVFAVACSPAPPTPAQSPAPAGSQVAIFAGGCFWSSEKAFENVRGVSSVVSGFTGGTVTNPSYAEVVQGRSGHHEAIRVTFDPRVVTYRQLVDRFWRTIDPTDPNGVFCDQGPSYRTAVFATPSQTEIANASKAAAERALGRRFVTPVRASARFWPAGAEHQDYARRSPVAYEAYRIGCRRSESLRRVWGDAAVT